MTWVVLAESLAILVLGLLVVALAHSYAGLAARVAAPPTPRPGEVALRPRAAGRTGRAEAREAAALTTIEGTSIDGERCSIPLLGAPTPTLLAFLSSSCTSCAPLWAGLAAALEEDQLAATRLLVVVKGPERESPAALADLAPPAADVVAASGAWAAFGVPGSPYFVLVGPDGDLLGEGTARSWGQVLDLVALADADGRRHGAWGARRPAGDLARESEVDHALLAAGILPGDASLYPTPRRDA